MVTLPRSETAPRGLKMRTRLDAGASATPLPALMARTCALLGPDLAIRAGIDLRLKHIAAERRWMAAMLILTSPLTVWIGSEVGAMLAATTWSAVIVRTVHHRRLLRRVAPAQVMLANELMTWQSAMHALPDSPRAEITAIPLDELRRRPIVRAIDVARACALIALAEESRMRRSRTPTAHRPPDHASDA